MSEATRDLMRDRAQRRAMEKHELRQRAEQAEGDFKTLRSDLAAAHYGTDQAEWTVADVIRTWNITADEATGVNT